MQQNKHYLLSLILIFCFTTNSHASENPAKTTTSTSVEIIQGRSVNATVSKRKRKGSTSDASTTLNEDAVTLSTQEFDNLNTNNQTGDQIPPQCISSDLEIVNSLGIDAELLNSIIDGSIIGTDLCDISQDPCANGVVTAYYFSRNPLLFFDIQAAESTRTKVVYQNYSVFKDCASGEVTIYYQYFHNNDQIQLALNSQISCAEFTSIEETEYPPAGEIFLETIITESVEHFDCYSNYFQTGDLVVRLPMKQTYNTAGELLPGQMFETLQLGTVTDVLSVVDEAAPILEQVPDNLTIDCKDYPADYLLDEVVATDDCSNLDISYSDDISPDCSTTSTIIRTWFAVDNCGNTTTSQTTLTVLPSSSPDCNTVQVDTEENSLTISNLDAPHLILTIYKEGSYGSLQFIDNCVDGACGTTYTVPNLSEGDYLVEIRYFTQNWQPICQTFKSATIGSDGGGGSTIEVCGKVTIETTNKVISFNGFGDLVADIQIFNAYWQPIFNCSDGTCPTPLSVDNIASGKHFIIIKLYEVGPDKSYTLVCNETVEVTVPDSKKNTSFAIPNVNKQHDFSILPNPAQHRIDLGLKQFRGKMVDIHIYNQFGELVLERHFDAAYNLERISLEEFDNGLYFVKLKAFGHRAITKKLVVSKLY